MTELVEDFIDIVYEVRSSFANVTITNGTSNLGLIRQVLLNEKLLAELANRTALTATYINKTIYSIYESVDHIENVCNLRRTLDDNKKDLVNSQTYVYNTKVLVLILESLSKQRFCQHGRQPEVSRVVIDGE